MELPFGSSVQVKLGLGTLLLASAAQAALAQTTGDCIERMGAFWGGGFGHMFFGWFMMLFFWAGLIALVALAVRWVASGSRGNGSAPFSVKTPRQILDERFARGEIDKDEFEDRKKVLAA